MSFKIIAIGDDIQLISCLTNGAVDDDALQFFCHHKNEELSYCEKLPMLQFDQRIRQLNKRVHFPANDVRAALTDGNPITAVLGSRNTEDVEGQEQQQTVLSLKYRVEGAPAPLKWEWHLTLVDNAQFYRCLMQDALSAATYLNKSVQSLLEVVRKKDVELNQFHIEGFHLRRTTVATERFDVDAFQLQHKQILTNVSTYEQVGHALNVRPGAPAVSSIKSEAPAKVARSVDMATTIPSIDAGKTLSPRNRKRKAMETGIQHVERKALQRRRVPQLLYKDSQSQEDDLDACLKDVKPEQVEDIIENGIKQEINNETSPNTSIKEFENEISEAEKVEDVLENGIKQEAVDVTSRETLIHEVANELDDIMQMINRTAKQTNKMLEENSNK